MIGLTRRILDSLLITGTAKKLTHETLITFLAEASAIINSRPLVPVPTDPEYPFILTPYTLLTQKTDKGGEPPGPFDEKVPSKRNGKEFNYSQTSSGNDGVRNIYSPFKVDKSGHRTKETYPSAMSFY